jgi:hypothetical protein
MCTFFSHKGNGNRNDIEILLYVEDYSQENKQQMCQRWEEGKKPLYTVGGTVNQCIH